MVRIVLPSALQGTSIWKRSLLSWNEGTVEKSTHNDDGVSVTRRQAQYLVNDDTQGSGDASRTDEQHQIASMWKLPSTTAYEQQASPVTAETATQASSTLTTVYAGTDPRRPVTVVEKSSTLQTPLSSETFVPITSASRFLRPWRRIPRVHLPTLAESNFRVMYSPLRRLQSDGLGHGFGTVNSEVNIALRLGLTYTHRAPLFGSLTHTNSKLMEDFFGWHANLLNSEQFHRENCIQTENSPQYTSEGVLIPELHRCRICEAPNSNGAANMKRIVRIPSELIFRYHSQPDYVPFLDRYNESHTIFQMDDEFCHSSPLMTDFSVSRPFFYWKYWTRHHVEETDLEEQQMRLTGRPGAAFSVEGSSKSAAIADNPLRFHDGELIIAVHVRRGDFFKDAKRKMIWSQTYVQMIRTAQDVVEEMGGAFSIMPIAVYIYSEGKPRDGHGYTTHAADLLTHDYVDEMGVVRDAAWWVKLLESTPPQTEGRPMALNSRKLNVPRVELRISRPTVESLHQMIAADVFIGSVSGMSMHLVRALSRGVGIYPGLAGRDSQYCCGVPSDADTGVIDRQAFYSQWSEYKDANEKFVSVAVKADTKEMQHGYA
jgi:hypothetical protein